MRRLSERVVIVTGGARGLGLAYARSLAEAGATVVIADIAECGDKMSAWPDSARKKVRIEEVDVTSYVEVEELVARTESQFGRVDVLVNNAAIFSNLVRKPFHELDTQEWDKILSVNVIGVFHCVKAVFPTMKAQNYGKIINISSDAALKGLPNLLHYVTSKGAIVAMTRSLAQELGPYNITVNAIAPGYTPHGDIMNEERNAQVIKLRALKRTQTPDDLLGAILFFASSDSDFVTGQTLVVDGGEVFH